jgi:hypothetical protein
MIEQKKETNNNKKKVNQKHQILNNKKDLLKEIILIQHKVKKLGEIGKRNGNDKLDLKTEYIREETKTWLIYRKHLTFFFVFQIQPEKIKKTDKLIYIPITKKNSLLVKNIIFNFIILQYLNPVIKNFFKNDKIIELVIEDYSNSIFNNR